MDQLFRLSTFTVWKRGAVVEVAWGCGSNHGKLVHPLINVYVTRTKCHKQVTSCRLLQLRIGGGYSYRLCKKGKGKNVSEHCFQQNQLHFAGNSSWIQYGESKDRTEIPRVTVTEGTTPSGSEWARNPVPSCNFCDFTDCPAPPAGSPANSQAYIAQQKCAQICAGGGGGGISKKPYNKSYCAKDANGVPMTQFKEAVPGLSGYTWLLNNGEHGETWGAAFNLIDRVIIPTTISPGEYLLSWRWDSEGTFQVFQHCADVNIV